MRRQGDNVTRRQRDRRQRDVFLRFPQCHSEGALATEESSLKYEILRSLEIPQDGYVMDFRMTAHPKVGGFRFGSNCGRTVNTLAV